MKTMTCRQMSGPCDTEMTAATSNEMMEMGAAHLNEMAEKGDEEHKKALEMMNQAEANPEMGKAWYEKFTSDFASQPDA